METQSTNNTSPTDNYIFLNGKQLAEVLDVAAPSLSEAVKKRYNCGGYPVYEWAVETDTGRIKGYEVPEFLVAREYQLQEKRQNPVDKTPNQLTISPNKGKNRSNKPEQIINNYSLLPEGEDYVRPAGMVTLPLVLKKALDQDTPQSRAVIGAIIAMLGAITGHAVSNNSTGAGIGAMAGFGIALYMYKYSNPNNSLSSQPALTPSTNSYNLLKSYSDLSTQSGFLPN
ncbi:glycine zipper family protein [Halalkalibaculum sp. DA384]|uniref:glycine zipper family protein n=1 Tax=Halalkalibaculum sp. DA384 TaxID=3373606 RepID=UPI0037548B92